MPTNLVDLDKLDPLPVPVKIAGETFKVPGAAPLSWLFRLRQLEDTLGDATEAELVETVRDMVADLIELEQPGRRKAAVDALNRKSATVVLQAIRAIYAGQAEAAPEDDAAPPRQGSTTTRKRSSRSSAAKRTAGSR